MATIRVAGIQMTVSTKLSENLERIITHIEKNDCDFMLFPAMSLMNHAGEITGTAVAAAWRQIAAACRQAYVTAIIGAAVRIENATYIQSRVYSDMGVLLGTHEMLVPPQADRPQVSPGDELRIFQHRGIVFGCLIGNDLWVAPGMGPYPDPRLTLQLAKRGAQFIFHSCNTGTDPRYAAYYDSNLTLRAAEANAHIFTTNAAEADGELNVPSGAIAPGGVWIKKVPRTGDHRYTVDVEVE